TRSALEGDEGLAAVRGAVGTGVGDVEDVFVFRIDLDLGEVVAASPQAPLAVDKAPAIAGVVGAIEAAGLGVDHGEDKFRVAAGDADADASQAFARRGQAFGERSPGVAAVGGFVEAAA